MAIIQIPTLSQTGPPDQTLILLQLNNYTQIKIFLDNEAVGQLCIQNLCGHFPKVIELPQNNLKITIIRLTIGISSNVFLFIVYLKLIIK